jgi:hypothetical protein
MGLRKLIGLDGAEKAQQVGEFRESVPGVDRVDMRPLPLDAECVDCFPSLRRCIDCEMCGWRDVVVVFLAGYCQALFVSPQPSRILVAPIKRADALRIRLKLKCLEKKRKIIIK